MFIVYGYHELGGIMENRVYGYINHVLCSKGNVEKFMLSTDTCEWMVPGTVEL